MKARGHGTLCFYGAPGTGKTALAEQIARSLDRPLLVKQASAQVSIMTEGGSGTPVPDLSIEVDDLDAALARVKAAGIAIEYGPADEPWGVRRFYVRDPFGKLVNILVHA